MLTRHQVDQLAIATGSRIGILSGSAGTGKTYCASEYVRLFGEHAVQAVCPTGKAAQRLSESFRENSLQVHATTIHAALSAKKNGDNWHFTRTETNPLNAGLLVVDEVSMVDTSLMSSLLAAVGSGTRVLLLGDPGQLSPVGKGKPYHDMIESGCVPHGHLTEPHRFAGRIGKVCQQLRNGERWQPSPKLDLEAEFPENFRHFECLNSKIQLRALDDVIGKMSDSGQCPIQDIQVICAVNDTGPLSRKKLNLRIQALCNPDGEGTEKGTPIRVGDKVICLKNGRRLNASHSPIRRRSKVFSMDGDFGSEKSETYIANGEMGVATEVTPKCITARMGKSVVQFNRGQWRDLDLGWAITAHKSQGSQWPVVISMIDDYNGANYVCSRAWHYTALSRAAKTCITIGRRLTIDRHCRNVDLEKRKTFLTERIQSACQYDEMMSL